MTTATANVAPMTDDELAQDRANRNARRRGINMAGLLQQQARARARRSKRQAEVNDVLCEAEIRAAAWDISEACHRQNHLTVADVLAQRDNPSSDYTSAVAGFVAQADQVGAIVLTGQDVFVADYELLLEVLSAYLQ